MTIRRAPRGAIHDPDVRRLAEMATELRRKYVDMDSEWASSPFAWIKACPSRQVGKIGEQLVAKWCGQHGLSVGPVGDPGADLMIQGHRVEVKFSTLWKKGGYRYQQVRDQDYAFLICLGVSPTSAHCWILPKEVLYDHVIGHTPQHKGGEGTDTYWITVKDPDQPDQWLAPYGGTLAAASQILMGSIGRLVARTDHTSPVPRSRGQQR